MANVEQTAEAPKGTSLVLQLGLFAGLTVAALAVGWLSGAYLKNSENPAPPRAAHAGGADDGAAPPHGASNAPGALVLVELAPLTTNLAAPAEIWVRLDASLVLDAPQPPELVEAIHQDLLAFLRTVKMHQVEGASGYQHLKADLQERASIRSQGHVKDVLIRTLLFE
ncbi:flagellar basal body-associated FliL family protein [Mesorhizobium sp. BE184]|uniref:flagellar basal body-associated FliL family protein n=1 Tax=Mesorhizobium sp. BE184 TaxID=2817714 RepID=UPI0028570336|nr:flagellar basal body-associated FliL family protein [Mesorhizobium sp. BE184]MDR7034698.1 flagellar FliL protein [Mesorhizobium sp. BE184]